MGNFCANCGADVKGARFCRQCGTRVAPDASAELTQPAAAPAAGDARLVTCPGCHTTAGHPGALCPACGSRYPNNQLAAVGVGALLAGVTVYGLGALVHVDTISGIGALIGFIGLGLAVYGSGRVGPAQQQSCCGCSCLILLLVLPVGAFALYTNGAPLLAALALPLWVPVAHAADITWRLVGYAQGAIRAVARRMR